MKAQRTMTPAEEVAWLKQIKRGPFASGIGSHPRAREWGRAQRDRELAASHEGKAARLAGVIAFLEWFGL